ncbi:uncharacterized protein [Hetaerina americana]|uniref:uncharacterized protein n=1 Tax=Hetaerina americana TaxID=62018 RepID=UPI003A7F3B8F
MGALCCCCRKAVEMEDMEGEGVGSVEKLVAVKEEYVEAKQEDVDAKEGDVEVKEEDVEDEEAMEEEDEEAEEDVDDGGFSHLRQCVNHSFHLLVALAVRLGYVVYKSVPAGGRLWQVLPYLARCAAENSMGPNLKSGCCRKAVEMEDMEGEGVGSVEQLVAVKEEKVEAKQEDVEAKEGVVEVKEIDMELEEAMEDEDEEAEEDVDDGGQGWIRGVQVNSRGWAPLAGAALPGALRGGEQVCCAPRGEKEEETAAEGTALEAPGSMAGGARVTALRLRSSNDGWAICSGTKIKSGSFSPDSMVTQENTIYAEHEGFGRIKCSMTIIEKLLKCTAVLSLHIGCFRKEVEMEDMEGEGIGSVEELVEAKEEVVEVKKKDVEAKEGDVNDEEAMEEEDEEEEHDVDDEEIAVEMEDMEGEGVRSVEELVVVKKEVVEVKEGEVELDEVMEEQDEEAEEEVPCFGGGEESVLLLREE